MSHLAMLQAAVDRARYRVRIAEANLALYRDCNMADPAQARMTRKLKADLDSAVRNAQWIEGQLEAARDVEGVNL